MVVSAVLRDARHYVPSSNPSNVVASVLLGNGDGSFQAPRSIADSATIKDALAKARAASPEPTLGDLLKKAMQGKTRR